MEGELEIDHTEYDETDPISPAELDTRRKADVARSLSFESELALDAPDRTLLVKSIVRRDECTKDPTALPGGQKRPRHRSHANVRGPCRFQIRRDTADSHRSSRVQVGRRILGRNQGVLAHALDKTAIWTVVSSSSA